MIVENEDRLCGILKSKPSEIGFTIDMAASAGDASAALELINYDARVFDPGPSDGCGLVVLSPAGDRDSSPDPDPDGQR